jgi:hypothetical protein
VTKASDLRSYVPQTHAERQASYRQRQAAEIEALRSALADARSTAAAQAARTATVEAERDRLYVLLEEAQAAPEPSRARAPGCPHPAALVSDDRCTGCGEVLDW